MLRSATGSANGSRQSGEPPDRTMKKRRVYYLLLLIILAAFAVWLEPTRIVWGWLRGEAFYQGRPTSWWRRELHQPGYLIPVQETIQIGETPNVFQHFVWESTPTSF